jgi:hypothetical protein
VCSAEGQRERERERERERRDEKRDETAFSSSSHPGFLLVVPT